MNFIKIVLELRLGKNVFFGFVFLAVCTACKQQRILDTKIDFTNHVWYADSLLKFSFQIQDTGMAYDMYYVIRNDLYYPYYNLYVKYQIYTPTDSVLFTDLQEMYLMDAKTGQPYGSGIGDVYDHLIYTNRSFKFPKPGNYTLTLQHYMRDNALENIHAMGVCIMPKVK